MQIILPSLNFRGVNLRMREQLLRRCPPFWKYIQMWDWVVADSYAIFLRGNQNPLTPWMKMPPGSAIAFCSALSVASSPLEIWKANNLSFSPCSSELYCITSRRTQSHVTSGNERYRYTHFDEGCMIYLPEARGRCRVEQRSDLRARSVRHLTWWVWCSVRLWNSEQLKAPATGKVYLTLCLCDWYDWIRDAVRADAVSSFGKQGLIPPLAYRELNLSSTATVCTLTRRTKKPMIDENNNDNDDNDGIIQRAIAEESSELIEYWTPSARNYDTDKRT